MIHGSCFCGGGTFEIAGNSARENSGAERIKPAVPWATGEGARA